MDNHPMVIDYYSDILCVWAWIAQRRIDELNAQLGGNIILRYHYVDVFGDTEGKMQSQWAERGLHDGFASHVVESAAEFESAPVNPAIWKKIRPASSANAHLFLKAIEILFGATASTHSALLLRQAFFKEAVDISDLSNLYHLAGQQGLDNISIRQAINDGSAMAALMSDYQKARQLGIKGSPTYVIDGGRQTLYGNVGYRVLLANIEELRKRPADEASWC